MPVRTSRGYTKARIESIDDARVRADLDAGRVVIITGFQGIHPGGKITTPGRGGSETFRSWPSLPPSRPMSA